MQNDFKKKALHLFVLSALALAQPFFYVLGENGTFLIAHNVGPTDLILLTFVLMAGLPLLFIFIIFQFRNLNIYLYEGVYISLFVILSGVTALPITKDIPFYPGSIKILLALLIGLMAYVTYRRYQPVKLFLSYLAPLVFFFPVNFIFYTDASKLFFPNIQENRHPISDMSEESKIPIFLIVLDEFPVTSLMNEYGLIDSIRYPNFDTLSKNSHWFRNATAVSEWTDLAVPAILTGKYPPKTRTLIPLEEDYPDNLFTLLEPHYEFKVFEELTKLCFSEKCGKPRLSELPERTLSIYSDLMVLFGHAVLPSDYSKEIPSIHNRWRNFKSRRSDGAGNIHDDRLERVKDFIEAIHPQNKSTLYFLHLTLPHSPTIYLPSGKAYDETENIIIGREQGKGLWTLDSWLVTQAYQRHLLQVGYTDKLIGRIIQKMKAANIFDEALLIVTADHGISFLPGQRARGYTQFNYPDILSVPLFIKLPHQTKGSLKNEPVKTIDILPAILATIKLPAPWAMDGDNPFDTSPKNARDKRIAALAKINSNPRLEILRFPLHPDSKYKTLKKKYLLFGSGPQDLLYQIGPGKNLLGLKAEDALKSQHVAPVNAKIERTGSVVHVDKHTNFIPSWIVGTLPKLERPRKIFPRTQEPSWMTGEPIEAQNPKESSQQPLAIAVNGIIQATTQTNYFSKPDQFAAMIPERAFREGTNEISIFKIIHEENGIPSPTTTGRKIHLYRPDNSSYIWNKHQTRYTLTQSKDQSFFLMDSDGKQFNIPPEKAGSVELVRYSPEAMYFFGFIKGWQGLRNEIPFLVFNNHQLVFEDKMLIPQISSGNPEDIIKIAFRIPVYQNKKVNLNNLRIILVDEKLNFMEMEMASKVLAYPKNRIPKHRFYGALSYCEDESASVENRKASIKALGENFSNECF